MEAGGNRKPYKNPENGNAKMDVNCDQILCDICLVSRLQPQAASMEAGGWKVILKPQE